MPIGSREVLETAPVSAVTRFYHDWYRPDLMAVIAVGDFDPHRVESLIRERFGDLREPRGGARAPGTRAARARRDPLRHLHRPGADRHLGVDLHQAPRRPQDTLGDYRRSLVELLYHRDAQRPPLRGRPPAEPAFLYAFSDSDSLVRTGEVDQQEAGVEPGRVLDGLRALLTEIERVRRFGFTESELERNRKALLRAYERTWVEREARASGSFAAEYSRAFLEGEPIPGIGVEVELARRYVPAITLDEINALADRRTGDANRVILVSGPESAADAATVRGRAARRLRAGARPRAGTVRGRHPGGGADGRAPGARGDRLARARCRRSASPSGGSRTACAWSSSRPSSGATRSSWTASARADTRCSPTTST